MAKVFTNSIDELARKSGYSSETLQYIWDEHLKETGEFPDWDYFVRVSMEGDW